VQAPLGAVPRLALGLLAEAEHHRQTSCPRRGSLLILNVALSTAGDAVGPDPRDGGLAQTEPPGQRRVVQCAPLSAGVSWQVTRVPAATVPSVSGGLPLRPPTTRRWLALLPVQHVVRAGRPRQVFVLFGAAGSAVAELSCAYSPAGSVGGCKEGGPGRGGRNTPRGPEPGALPGAGRPDRPAGFDQGPDAGAVRRRRRRPHACDRPDADYTLDNLLPMRRRPQTSCADSSGGSASADVPVRGPPPGAHACSARTQRRIRAGLTAHVGGRQPEPGRRSSDAGSGHGGRCTGRGGGMRPYCRCVPAPCPGAAGCLIGSRAGSRPRRRPGGPSRRFCLPSAGHPYRCGPVSIVVAFRAGKHTLCGESISGLCSRGVRSSRRGPAGSLMAAGAVPGLIATMPEWCSGRR